MPDKNSASDLIGCTGHRQLGEVFQPFLLLMHHLQGPSFTCATMAAMPAYVVQTGGRLAQAAAARLLSRRGQLASPWAGNRGYVATALHAPAAAAAACARPRRPSGARLVSSRPSPTMGLKKVKLGGSDLEVTQVSGHDDLGCPEYGGGSVRFLYWVLPLLARCLWGPYGRWLVGPCSLLCLLGRCVLFHSGGFP